MCVTPSKRSELQVRPAYRKRRATLADVRALSVAAVLLMVVSASCAGCAKKDASAEGPPPAVAVKTIVAENATIPDESEYLATLKSVSYTHLIQRENSPEGQTKHLRTLQLQTPH